MKVRGALTVEALGDADASSTASAAGVASSGVGTAIAANVAIVSLTALLGGKVELIDDGDLTVRTRISATAPGDGVFRPRASATAGAGSQNGIGAAGAFGISVAAFLSTASILPTAEVYAAGNNVYVYAHANADNSTQALAPDNGAAADAVGAVVSIAISTNVTSATVAGHIVEARDVRILAAADSAMTGSLAPTYTTTATANGGSFDATRANAVLTPAVAFAFATNVTVAAILPGALIGVTKPAVTGTDPVPAVPASPVHDVLVKAQPIANTTSTARIGTGTLATIGGPLAVTLALDTTFAGSAGTIDATAEPATPGSVRVVALSADRSNANAAAGTAGVLTDGNASADGQMKRLCRHLQGAGPLA